MLKFINYALKNSSSTRQFCTEIFGKTLRSRTSSMDPIVRQFLRKSIQENGLSDVKVVNCTILREALQVAAVLRPEQKAQFIDNGLNPIVDRIIEKLEKFDPSLGIKQWPFSSYYFLRKLTLSYNDDRVLKRLGVERITKLTDYLADSALRIDNSLFASICLVSAFKIEYVSSVKPIFPDVTRSKLIQLLEKLINLYSREQDGRVGREDVVNVLYSAYERGSVPVPQQISQIDKILHILTHKPWTRSCFIEKDFYGDIFRKWATVLAKLYQTDQRAKVAEHLSTWLDDWVKFRKNAQSRAYNHSISLYFLDLCLHYDRLDLLEREKSFLVEHLNVHSKEDEEYRNTLRKLCQQRLKKQDLTVDYGKLMTDLVSSLSDSN